MAEQESPSATPATREPYLGALRGLAILGVVLVHTGQLFDHLPDPISDWVAQGARGVQLFFVLSAVTLCLSWRRRSDGVVAFYVRRFFRIAPIFWLAIVVYLAVYKFDPRYWAPSGISWVEVAFTAVFAHGVHPRSATSVVPGGWSIAAEMTFYLAFPLIMFAVRSAAAAAVALALAVAFSAILTPFAVAAWTAELPSNEAYLADAYGYFWLPFQLPCFMIGILTYWAIRRYPARLQSHRLNWPLAAILIMLAVRPLIPVLQVALPYQYALMFGALTYLLANGAGLTLSRSRMLSALGEISFSAYLWHFLVLEIIARILPKNLSGPTEALLLVPTFFATLTLTAVVSTISYRIVETPMIRAGSLVASSWNRVQRVLSEKKTS